MLYRNSIVKAWYMRWIRLDPRFPYIIDPITPVASGIRWDRRSNSKNYRGTKWDPRSTVDLHHGIQLDHGSNTAFRLEIFWDHRSDFGIHGHVWLSDSSIARRMYSWSSLVRERGINALWACILKRACTVKRVIIERVYMYLLDREIWVQPR